MLAAWGNKVEALHREHIGAIVLDAGAFRSLSEEEIHSL
jgi:16S rRNA U516 pseudouridylate synthase RsuA-like enzyme